MRSHSSSAWRKSSEVLSNCPARREGSAEYIGIKQPVAPESISAAIVANKIRRIAAFLPELPRAASRLPDEADLGVHSRLRALVLGAAPNSRVFVIDSDYEW
jgi:hypothetical protein